MVRSSYFTVLLQAAFFTRFSSATCYRQGNKMPMPQKYAPCNSFAPFSMCWRTQDDGAPKDRKCLPNGITQNFNAYQDYEYWRQGCTDPTWESPYCQKAFAACPVDDSGNARISPCDGEDSVEWCCGGNNTDCCGTSAAIRIAKVVGPASTTTTFLGPTSFQTDAPTSGPTTSPTSTPTNRPEHKQSSGLPIGAKAGIGATAGLVGLAIILGIILFVLKKIKNRRSATVIEEKLHDYPRADVGGLYEVGSTTVGLHHKKIHEMHSTENMHDAEYQAKKGQLIQGPDGTWYRTYRGPAELDSTHT